MSNGDEKRPHEITGDDVKPDATPVPAEQVTNDPVTDKPASSQVPPPGKPTDKDDEGH